MIEVSRLNGKKFIINSELVKFIEATPDTVITLTTGEKLMVLESTRDVLRMCLEWKRSVSGREPELGAPKASG